MIDLWPAIEGSPDVRAPVILLKEQASLLGRKTRNIVKAQVDGAPLKEDFHYTFQLVAPALQFYKFELFTIIYNIGLYPVYFELESDLKKELRPDFKQNQVLRADSEESFLQILKEIFNAKRTKTAINTLIAHSGASAETVSDEAELPF